VSYGTQVTLDAPFAEAVTRVRAALAAQGFGVLTEIDVTATLKAKVGEQIEDYVILGACNPPAAHRPWRSTAASACWCRAMSWSAPLERFGLPRTRD